MRPRPFHAALAASFCFVPALHAQDGIDAHDPNTPAVLGADAFRSPIHTGPQNRHGFGGDYGLWASGDTYKASFHGGALAYYPVLGTAYPHNLPVSWRTLSVRAGATELLGTTQQEERSDWRFERRSGEVVERYDVLAEGIEQSFVVEALPAGFEGDLVVLGGVDTELRWPRAEQPADAQRSIAFTDAAGNEIVGYGEAIAFDARGERTPVRTGWHDGAIELVVPAAFVARAELPITIDPMLTTRILSSSGGEVGSVDVARDDETDKLMVVYSRASSASDYDCWARRTDDDYSNGLNLFVDVQSRHTNQHQSVAFVGGTNEWVLAYEMTYSDTGGVILYSIQRTETTVNNGDGDLVIPPSDRFDTMPSLGGTPGNDSGDRVCLTWRQDWSTSGPANTPNSAIYAAIYDCRTNSFVRSDLRVYDVAGADAEAPCINRMNAGGPDAPWVVVFQTHSGAGGEPWRIRGRMLHPNGGFSSLTELGETNGTLNHNLRPKIAGADGRYAVVWTERPNVSIYQGGLGKRVLVQRVSWPAIQMSGSAGPVVEIAATSLMLFDLGPGRSIGYDRLTKSHWTVAYQQLLSGLTVDRLGFDMGVTERVLMAPVDNTLGRPGMPAVCFDDDHRRFPVAWMTDGNIRRVHGNLLTYSDQAVAQPFGTSCVGRLRATNENNSPPYAGSEFFELQLRSGLPFALSYMLAGNRLAQSPMTLPGSSACRLLLDPSATVIIAGAGFANLTGSWDLPISIPSAVGPSQLFWQVVQLGNGGLTATDGLDTAIR